MRALIWPRRAAMLCSSAGKLFFAVVAPGSPSAAGMTVCRAAGADLGFLSGDGACRVPRGRLVCRRRGCGGSSRSALTSRIRGSCGSSARCPRERAVPAALGAARRQGARGRAGADVPPAGRDAGAAPGEAAYRRLGRPALGDLSRGAGLGQWQVAGVTWVARFDRRGGRRGRRRTRAAHLGARIVRSLASGPRLGSSGANEHILITNQPFRLMSAC
jgi:hypothetical protein